MTRWARGKPSKLPHEAAEWKDMKKGLKTASERKPRPKQNRNHSIFKQETKKVKSVRDKLIQRMWYKEKRKEQRRLQRIKERAAKKVCFNCREHGHKLQDCPNIVNDLTQGTGICFKCGSSEHVVQKCPVKTNPGKYPYAKCFICKKQGHISKDCPKNSHGLYPKGGCCIECGSVKHFKKDCPEFLKKQGITDVKLEKLDGSRSADAITELSAESEKPQKTKKKTKVVKF